MSNTYWKRKARGVCPWCEGVPRPDRVYCQECAMVMQLRRDIARSGDAIAVHIARECIQRELRWREAFVRTNMRVQIEHAPTCACSTCVKYMGTLA